MCIFLVCLTWENASADRPTDQLLPDSHGAEKGGLSDALINGSEEGDLEKGTIALHSVSLHSYRAPSFALASAGFSHFRVYFMPQLLN